MRREEAIRIVEKKLGAKVIAVENKSHGWAHQVFVVSTHKGNAVVRVPLKDPNKLKVQAWACKKWLDIGASVPTPLLLTRKYLLESCIPGKELYDARLSQAEKKRVVVELGKQLKRMHRVKTRKFGFFDHPGTGSWLNWDGFIGSAFVENLGSCLKSNKISMDQASDLLEEYVKHKKYLMSFNKPCLVHSDLSTRNIMVHRKKFSGIIDAADAFSGDALYDLGDAYYEFGDKKVLNWLEQGYGKFNRDLARFYALAAVIWCLAQVKGAEAKKIRKRLVYLLRTRV